MERLRQWIRARLGYRAPVYRLGSTVLTALALLVRARPAATVAILRLYLAPTGIQRAVKLPGIAHPFFIRSNSRDLATVLNNFVRHDYGQFPEGFAPCTIVDAGAYIGDTSAYFLSRYAEAKVVALEPCTESFTIARRNREPYGSRVTVRRAALGPSRGTACISGHETGAAISNSGQRVPVITVPDLLSEIPGNRIDLLKLDIEGAEREILRTGSEPWLANVGRIVVEMHGEDIEREVLAWLRERHWNYRRYRNLWYCEPVA